jgi:hypothetical protein
MTLSVEYRDGRGEGGWRVPDLNPILAPLFGADLFSGSLNLWADHGVTLPNPAARAVGDELWWFSPIILGAQAAGIAARRADSGNIEFIEVYAPRRLAPQLGLINGSRLTIRILDGRHLAPAA